MGVEGYQRSDISDQEARKRCRPDPVGLHAGNSDEVEQLKVEVKRNEEKRLRRDPRGRRVRREEKSKRVAIGWDSAAIPPLRGPTRQKAARKEKSDRSGRDDKIGGTARTSGRDQRTRKRGEP
jgi:hypothetical protein